jgi:hypothetical protein
MSKIFISYSRQSEAMAKILVNDFESLGHDVWFDRELSGGQVWWDHILDNIRGCDVFVFLLDPKALNSTACQREWGYAKHLGKLILPVLAADGVSINLLPPELSQIQYVDYRKQDRSTAFSLARALASIPPAKPLPDPLPPPPEVPVSYLGGLARKIDNAATLSYEEQSALLTDLRTSFRDAAIADDSRALLEKLRKRRDLFATIAAEIDDLLGRQRQSSPVFHATSIPAPHPKHVISLRERLLATFVGAAIGTMLGEFVFFPLLPNPNSDARLIWVVIEGTAGAIIGMISGAHKRTIVVVLVGLVLGSIVWAIIQNTIHYSTSPSDRFLPALFFGAPIGAILGATAGAIMRNKMGQR